MIASKFSLNGSLQSLFTISEYFQLLITLLLLNAEFPGKVYKLLHSFSVYKFDLELLQKFFGVGNLNSVNSNILPSSERFQKVDINYQSTLINFSVMIGVLIIIILVHILIQIISRLTGFYQDAEDFISSNLSTRELKLSF